nr:hypothetical protein [uncultured Flavobacterium sp.]
MCDSSKELPFVPYPTIQTTKINTEVFTFSSPKEVTYPAAPLVTAKFYTPEGGPLTIKVRATLYMNSEIPDAPIVEPPTEKDNVLTINYDYDFSMETPETCDVWYVELDYTSDTVQNITIVESFMVNLDPETSRGTKTGVDG